MAGLGLATLQRNPGFVDLYTRNRTRSLGLAPGAPSYAAQVRSGALPFTDQGAGARFAAAGKRIAATQQPLPQPDSARLTPAQLLAQASGNQYGPINGTGLGLAGAWHGGAQPGTVAGKPAWVDGPPREASAGMLPSSRFVGGGTLGRAGAAPLSAISESDPEFAKMQAARKLFDARGGGLDARRLAYEQRQNAPPGQTPRQIRMARAADDMQRNFEMRLGLASPAAYASIAQSRGAQSLARSQQDATNAYRTAELGLRGDVLKQQERMATANNASREKIAGLGLAAKTGVDPVTGQPIGSVTAPPIPSLSLSGPKGAAPVAVPPVVHQQVREAANSGDLEKAREIMANAGVTSATMQDQALRDATGDPYVTAGFLDRPRARYGNKTVSFRDVGSSILGQFRKYARAAHRQPE